MIAKGSSRSGPKQLATYLMRVGRYDTGEPAELIELRSPWAVENGSRYDTVGQLIETFRDWHALAEGTQGEYGLYHAQISPAPKYATGMTPEQWKRAADILGEELGLQDQPRALVLHAGKDDRPHLHVVWSRTDIDEMKLVSDSFNYLAHERASQRMEKEFGQDFVPGKHAKRDREQQPEFPREEYSQDEDQQAKRAGQSVADRKAEIAALRAAADNAQAFKAAMEEAGYLLAKGDRGFIVVDEAGDTSVLSRNLGIKKKEVEAFMAGVELDKFPTIKEAQALQETRQRERKLEEAQKPAQETPQPEPAKPVEKAPEPGPVAEPTAPRPIDLNAYSPKEPSKFLPPELAQKIEPPPPAQSPIEQQRPIDLTAYGSKYLPPALTPPPSLPEPAKLPEPPAPVPPEPVSAPAARPIDLGAYSPKGEVVQPRAPEIPAPTQPDPMVEAIKKALDERHAKEVQKWVELNALELQRLEYDLERLNSQKAKDFAAYQAVAMTALKDKLNERRRGINAVLDGIQSKLNPTLAAEEAKKRSREIAQLHARQERERKDYLALIEQTKSLEIENLKNRHALQHSERENKHEEEKERHIREHHENKRRLAEIEAKRIHEELEKNDSLRDGPPPPQRGK